MLHSGNYTKSGQPILSREQNKFFSKHRSMQSVWEDLFKGDAFEANNFQNWALTNNLIIWNGSTFIKTDTKK